MQVSVSEAKAQLTELVRRAEAGDEVILTRHGHAAVRLVPVKATQERNLAGRYSMPFGQLPL
jgi:prevent-host-death family protein